MRKICLLILFFFFYGFLFAQKNKINPNGYNVFYYPNGFKASEGYMKNGKPDGYWITYYVNGQKKSEGNRKNFLLDSLWIFYDEHGDTTAKIWYRNGKKNGYYIRYYTRLDSFPYNIPKSKELYVNDKKQGFAYYYYPTGELHLKIPYKNNIKEGFGFEYAKDGRLIGIIEYKNNYKIEYRKVNRYDEKGNKIGTWVEVYPDGKIKKEITYKNGKIDGFVKEYTRYGKLKTVEVYKQGKKVKQFSADSIKEANIAEIIKKYPNGKIKSIQYFADSIPVGYHKFFDKNGNLIYSLWYSPQGFLLGKGKVDSLNRKQGFWILYYDTGETLAEGFYKNDLKDSLWKYFYRSGALLQQGKYVENYPVGVWKMYYEDGKLMKYETYDIYSNRNGLYFELKPDADTAVKGFYKNNFKEGFWFYNIGDEYCEGNYKYDKKSGLWQCFYMPDKILKSKIYYKNGLPDGKCTCYFPNKKVQIKGFYKNGFKQKKWFYYNEDGSLKYTITYQNDKIVKVNDLPVK